MSLLHTNFTNLGIDHSQARTLAWRSLCQEGLWFLHVSTKMALKSGRVNLVTEFAHGIQYFPCVAIWGFRDESTRPHGSRPVPLGQLQPPIFAVAGRGGPHASPKLWESGTVHGPLSTEYLGGYLIGHPGLVGGLHASLLPSLLPLVGLPCSPQNSNFVQMNFSSHPFLSLTPKTGPRTIS